MKHRPPIVALILVSVLLALAGCGLFRPRDPLPGGGPSVSCLVPDTPDAVVTNILQHYGALSGVTCYTQMLDAGFAFHPDAADSIAALPDTVYSNWGRDVESRDASNVASNATFSLAVFDSQYASPVISPDQRTQTRFYAYRLILHASQVAPDTLFQGLADITFFQGGDAQWHVTTWIDKRDTSGARTWGYVRRIFRVGF